MAAEKNLVYAYVFFILFSGVSASDFSGFFDQIKEVSRGFNLSNVGDLINEAVVPGSILEKGQDLFKKGQDLLKKGQTRQYEPRHDRGDASEGRERQGNSCELFEQARSECKGAGQPGRAWQERARGPCR